MGDTGVIDLEAQDHQGWALACHPAGGRGGAAMDLLFLHGMASGAWIWGEFFLAPFRAAGFTCWTVTLPGRAAGPTRATDPGAIERRLTVRLDARDPGALMAALPGASLLDGPDLDDLSAAVAAALAAAAAQSGRPVALVCHSLGGAIGQNLLRRRPAALAGLALLCSVPPYGLWRASAEMALRDPALWVALARFATMGRGAADERAIRRALFPGGISDAAFAVFAAQLRDESFPALVRCLGVPPFAPPPGPRRDVIVAGARRDAFVPAADLLATAAWYGTAPAFLGAAGHAPMIGPGARTAGTRLAERVTSVAGAWAAQAG